ncbi:MAG: 23S rRNA (adenine(2030)-N(6))-methyltransferase RlmJ [Sterolibacterium sp.]|nr:23S rRNA (adenine(2030)-N(6))-methyltransferase RlmJ [Sterolibacterium sp.]
MFSYRHAFHAGNHADVLKHFVLSQLIGHLCQKETPFWYIDTHAGAGRYALDSGYARQLSEYQDGIGRLWQRDDLPAALADYVDVVRQLNPDGQLHHYPGSPWIAHSLLREQDRIKLFELHSSDHPLLKQLFNHAGRRVQVQASDGYLGLKALLPPAPRRALVLIDPAYEDKQEYRKVVEVLREALQRFATGTYALWYPQLARTESRQLPDSLKTLPLHSWLHVSLSVTTAPAAKGMTGSGLFVINPPWTLAATLEATLPWLTRLLARDKTARYLIEQGEAKTDGTTPAARKRPAAPPAGRK